VIGESAQETLDAIHKLGRRAVAVQGDLSDTGDDCRVIREGVAQLGKIDILVNNAGVEKRADFWDVTEEEFDFVLKINLRGTFFITQDFVNHLRATNRPGRIINISSVHEELPFPHFSTYCASKGALKMLCRDLAIELAPLGITVNNIAPGAIETPINKALLNDPELLKMLLGKIPLGRLGTPRDVAGLAAFLASEDAAYITGSTFFVDGGLMWNYHEQ
jgi:glucose 1-dehydrogenase